MEDAANATQTTSTTSSVAAVAAAAQHQQLQRQLFLMQQAQAQAQAQAQPHPQAQQLSQQAMSRFPSNIDAHLRPLGPHRFQQPAPSQLQTPPQPHSQGQPHPQPSPQQAAQARVRSPEVEMALQDAMRVCNPDIKTPFHSLEDAVSRCAFHIPTLAFYFLDLLCDIDLDYFAWHASLWPTEVTDGFLPSPFRIRVLERPCIR
ncbi:unnamed protein product [Triticum turgidum subsp. durum]|uniref:Mediator of RNA polymerase II transcription subunit 15 n=1 Tax=Triticum turgidum subsp. durum TaxID=4567 RepID=A0A9R0WK95_TRITD|nr:unnamed protein product [Triticum turgidum subsp. durum]